MRESAMKSRNPSVVASLVLSAGLLASASASAGVLLGTGKLNTQNDLTLVQAGAKTYAFLDLSFTKGWSQARAIATYGVHGFAIATDVHLRELFSSFGFGYGNQKGGSFTLDVSDEQVRAFNSYLNGSTAAMGSFLDTSYGQSWSCISITNQGCNPGSFVENKDYSIGIFSSVYLVRQTGDVPEPGSFALIGLGVAGLVAARRRRHVRRSASGLTHLA